MKTILLKPLTSLPPVLLDSKTGHELREITAVFKYQGSPDTCYPVGIFNVLNELASRTNNNDVALSEARINRIARVKDFAAEQPKMVVDNLNGVLKRHGYRAHETRRTTTVEQLKGILKDETCSFPLIALSYRYLEVEQRVNFISSDPLLNPDHVVAVLMIDSSSDRMAFFDPYVGITPPMQRETGNGRGVVVKPIVRMLDDYWDAAWDKSWMFWIKWDKSKTERLTSYLEGGPKEGENQ